MNTMAPMKNCPGGGGGGGGRVQVGQSSSRGNLDGYVEEFCNSLPNDLVLLWFKLKAFFLWQIQFKWDYFSEMEESGVGRERVGCSWFIRPFQNNPCITCQLFKSFENTEKKRNCSKRAISSFPTVFPTFLENFVKFTSTLKLLSANSFNIEESKICRLGKG